MSENFALLINGSRFEAWESIAVTAGIEAFPRSFTVQAAHMSNTPFVQPGDPLTVVSGNDTLLTGYVDRAPMQIGPRMHGITLMGRGKCQDIADCSVDPVDFTEIQNGQINATSVLDLATRLCKPFGLTAKLAAGISDVAPGFLQLALGETGYEILSRAAKYVGMLVYEDANANLILDRAGTKSHASGCAEGENAESALLNQSLDERFSQIRVVWTSVNQLQELGSITNQRAIATDPSMPRKRTRVVVSDQIAMNANFGQVRAQWEMNRRIGRSQSLMATVDSWRDSAGLLWQPNMLVNCNFPSLNLTNKSWLIASVTYRKDLSGTHADLLLMPPAAFVPAPAVNTRFFDREIAQPVNRMDPAPG